MTYKEGVGSDSEEERNQLISQELASMEEIKFLKQQMTEMYKAWLNGQAPPSSILRLANIYDPNPAQAQTSDPFYLPGFSPYVNVSGVVGTSTMRPPNLSVINNTFFTSVAPATAGLQSSVQKNIGGPSHDELYPPEMTFKTPNLHYHAHQHDSPIVVEKIIKSEEWEEMARKVRSLEQSMRNMQELGGPKSVSYKDLCMFSDVHLPLGFKMPKFDKYEGHGDLVAHLRRYCNQLRGAGGKEELLMAYFGESLTNLASECFVDQDIDKWSSWNDLANEFVQQFKYYVELIPDEKSLTNIKKKNNKNFREYAIRWRGQAARVKPPMKESKIVEMFIQAQDETYYQHLLPALGKPFIEVLKIGEMIEDGIKSGRIVSFATLNPTTQVIQKGSGSVGEKENEEDASTIAVRPWELSRRPRRRRSQAQDQVHAQAPHNHSQSPLYSSPPPPYPVHNAQPYVQPLSYPQWHTPTPQSHPLIPQIYQNPSKPNFLSNPKNEIRQKSRDSSHQLESHMPVYFKD
ncbi:hypothetical protein P3L10_003196 [Capsicum annuum]